MYHALTKALHFVVMNTLSNVIYKKKKQDYVYDGFTSKVSPEARSSKTGVSTNSTHTQTPQTQSVIKSKNTPHWYALRCTYGREKKAYEYIISQKGVAFYPTTKEVKIINNKRKHIEISRIPNMLFAYGTEEEIQKFVYDNVNLPYLRFYYNHHHEGYKIIKKPLIIPDDQIESLRIICESESEDIIIMPNEVEKFKHGDRVRIVDGKFAGVTGQVARYHGQQRVGVIIDGLLTIATAYIPGAFLRHID